MSVEELSFRPEEIQDFPAAELSPPGQPTSEAREWPKDRGLDLRAAALHPAGRRGNCNRLRVALRRGSDCTSTWRSKCWKNSRRTCRSSCCVHPCWKNSTRIFAPEVIVDPALNVVDWDGLMDPLCQNNLFILPVDEESRLAALPPPLS